MIDRRYRTLVCLALACSLLIAASPPERSAKKFSLKIWGVDRDNNRIVEFDATLSTKKDLDKKPKLTGSQTGTPISVGKDPVKIAFDPAARAFLLVVNRKGKSVSRIDTATRAVTATYRVGKEPVDVDITPDGRYAFIANYKSNSVSAIDLESGTVLGAEKFGKRPNDLQVTADGETLLITHLKSRTIVRTRVDDFIGGLRTGAARRPPSTKLKLGDAPVGLAAIHDIATAVTSVFISTFSEGAFMIPLAFVGSTTPTFVLGGPTFGVAGPRTCNSSDATMPCDAAILARNAVTKVFYLAMYRLGFGFLFADLPKPPPVPLLGVEWFPAPLGVPQLALQAAVGLSVHFIATDDGQSNAVFGGPAVTNIAELPFLGALTGFYYFG